MPARHQQDATPDMFAALALTAVLIEAVFGYPKWLLRRVGHPVMWIGALIAWCDARWNTPSLPPEKKRLNGALTLVLILLIPAFAALAACWAIMSLFGAGKLVSIFGWVLIAILASTLIAQRSLFDHVWNVKDALDYDGPDTANLPAGRAALAKIVSRETATLDEHDISRAAIESLAENFADGVVAPVFWLTFAGLPGAVAYKAINTADSMIGHRNDRYQDFGMAAARFDDLVNLPASRLAAFWLVIASALTPTASGKNAFVTLRRDAHNHRSPNAGWPEAAMAGALGISLSGPRIYDGITHNEPWMGNGRKDITPKDIDAALNLYKTACATQALALTTLAAITLLA